MEITSSQSKNLQNKSMEKMTKMKPIHYLEKGFSTRSGACSKVNLKLIKSVDRIWWDICTFNESLDQKSKLALQRLAAVVKSAKNVQNLTLWYSYAPITDKECSDMSQSLKNLHSLQNFHLNFGTLNKITEIGIFALSRSLREISSLKTLGFSVFNFPNITDKSYYHLAQGMKRLSLLQTLDFYFSQSSSITDRGLDYLSQGIKRLSSLEALKISFSQTSNITDRGLDYLSRGIKRLISLDCLRLIFEECNGITDAGFSSLCQNLGNLENLWTLDLRFWSCNAISDAGLDDFIDCLKKINELGKLDFGIKSSQITDLGMETLGSGLKNLTYLEVLVLDIECPKISDSGLISLGVGLASLRPLCHPYLGFNLGPNITDSGFGQFCKSLSQIADLRSIQFDFKGSRRWSNTEFSSLGETLRALPCLELFKLRIEGKENEFTDKEFLEISKSLGKLHSLREIEFRFCGIGDHGLKSLGKELKKLPVLNSIIIDFSLMQKPEDLTDLGVENFCKEIKKLSLRVFYFYISNKSKVTNKGRCKMLKCLKDIPSLQGICFTNEKGGSVFLKRHEILGAWKELVASLPKGRMECYLQKKKSIILKGIYMLLFCIILHIFSLYLL